ncbi:MAG: uroporphyrinogen-III C-methyltransferase [Gammaproteobacteria bacterium]|nr:uroporphyrinogen-III C-methyltransferase [Gammaproteobacteria bacterium]
MHIDNKPVADDDAAHARDAVAIEPPAPASAPAPSGGRAWSFGIALLALLCAGGGILAGYYFAQQFRTEQQVLAKHGDDLDAALQSASRRQDELTARLARVESDIPGVATELTEIEDLLRREALRRVEPADIERLLRMANDSLQLAGDIDTALLALRNADRRLQALGDPLFAEVRRRLAREITSLEAVPRPDVAGMAYALAGLQGELGALLLRQEAPEPADAAERERSDTDVPQWRVVARDIWASLKSLVVVRRREGGEPPLIAPGEQIFLTQNLYLKLESARVALLARDDRNFHASLSAARAWLDKYYDGGNAAVAAVAARLSEMDQVNIAPGLPDVSGSLDALHAALERRRAPGREDGGA